MVKFLYVVFLSTTSFFLFIHSKEKEEINSKNQAVGIVRLITDSTENCFLGIVTDQNITLHPSTLNEDAVLTAGQKVIVGYNVDSSMYNNDNQVIPVHIKSIRYQTP